MKTIAEFDAAVARFRSVPGGRVEVRDFFVRNRAPYRMALVKIACAPDGTNAQEVVRLAFETQGYLVLHTATSEPTFEIQVSRDLTEEETGDDDLISSREVV